MSPFTLQDLLCRVSIHVYMYVTSDHRLAIMVCREHKVVHNSSTPLSALLCVCVAIQRENKREGGRGDGGDREIDTSLKGHIQSQHPLN